MSPRVVLLVALGGALSLGCTEAEVIEVDAGLPAHDIGATSDATKEPEDAGFSEDAPDDVPGDEGAEPDRPPPRDVGPPRMLTCGPKARVEDPSGDTVVIGNEAGGRFTLVLDVAIANVGVIARGPVELTLNGDFVTSVRVVHFVGEGAAASTLNAPRGVALERGGTPTAPFADVTGHSTMSCASDCQPGRLPSDRGCNSPAQVTTYFERRFGEGRRMLHLQTSTLDGLYVFAGRGGCCLP
nr:hypothetical protein [Deltaproteobacteria bacterium]